MTQIIFITHEGAEHRVVAEPGQSVMQAALYNDVPDVVAECGGSAACATCRVFVDDAWIDRLPAPRPIETSMLDADDAAGPSLRLSCQLEVTPSMNGLIVRIPESQY